MPNLKDIRRRIKSVKSTQKITQAMRMVAAAKVKRAEARMKAAKPYSEVLFETFTEVYNTLKNQIGALEGSRYIELLKPRPVKNVGIVVISSDRGLCGAYNGNIIRQAFLLEREYREKGLEPKFYFVGTKIAQAFARYKKVETLGAMNMNPAPTVHEANQIAETMVNAFLNGEVDSIEILSTEYRSMISYRATKVELIPVKGKIPEYAENVDPSQGVMTESVPQQSASGLKAELILEPDPVKALDVLVPMYLSHTLYMRMLESVASELSSRMMAMTNATKNASDMIVRLSLVYNKARQATITQEILEVVSGAQALEG